jgi:hypothetical protein
LVQKGFSMKRVSTFQSRCNEWFLSPPTPDEVGSTSTSATETERDPSESARGIKCMTRPVRLIT